MPKINFNPLSGRFDYTENQASGILLPTDGGSPTNNTLAEDFTIRGSSGVIDGTLTYVTVGSTAVKISVAEGEGYIRTTNDQQGELKFCKWAASPDLYTFSAPATGYENTIFIGIEYSGGSVSAVSKTAFSEWNWYTNFPLARCSYDGTTVRILNAYAHSEDTANMTRKFLRLNLPFNREEAPEGSGGLELSVALRALSMTAGNIWHGFNKYTLNAIASPATFDTHYRRAGGGFVLTSGVTSYPNTQYDNGSGTLQDLTTGRYGTLWVYLDVATNELDIIYGAVNATSVALAQADTSPSIPAHLQYHGRLIGRIIFKKSDPSPVLVESAWSTMFAATTVGDHALLSNLQGGTAGEYYHFTSSDYTDLTDAGDSTLHYHASDRALDNATVTSAASAAFIEAAQDAVGAMIADTATIDLTYTDATPELKADVKDNSITEPKLAMNDSPSNGEVISWNASGSYMEWVTPAASGANTALSNLASVAVNTSLISDTDVTDDLGSDAKRWLGTYQQYGYGESYAFKVKNTSAVTTVVGDVGYIDENGEYKETTTVADSVDWVVCLSAGANNADIYVTKRGRVTVQYTGTAPSVGDYLNTSATGGAVQICSSGICPEAMAVAIAAGSAGLVEVLLLTGRKYCPLTNPNSVFEVSLASLSDFVATINGTPSGTSVVYNAPSAGTEDTIPPAASTQIGKQVLHNTTRGTSALISSVNTTTNTITLTANVPAGWASTDTITVRSQTNTDVTSSAYFRDIEITSGIPFNTIGLQMGFSGSSAWRDTGGVATMRVHPFETGAVSKRVALATQVANVAINSYFSLPLINYKFTTNWNATGTATTYPGLRLYGVYLLEA